MLKRALLEVLCGQRQFSTWLEKFDSVLIGTGEQSRDKYSKLLAKQQIIYEVQGKNFDIEPSNNCKFAF